MAGEECRSRRRTEATLPSGGFRSSCGKKAAATPAHCVRHFAALGRRGEGWRCRHGWNYGAFGGNRSDEKEPQRRRYRSGACRDTTLIIAYSWWIRGMVSVFKSLSIPGKICWLPNFSFTSEMSSLKMTLKDHGLHFFRSAVGAVLPGPILKRSLVLEPGGCPRLLLQGRPFELKTNLYLVGFGKAVLGMAAVAEDILGGYLTQGIISIPQGIQETLRHAGMREMLLKPCSRIQVLEGARENLPDKDALEAARAILELAKSLTADDLLLVLISGGGSALLPAPIPPVTLEDKTAITRLLASKGATIQELNTSRKALSLSKGGGLAQIAHPAQVLSLILSDVIGDPLDIIASGPTVASSHSRQDCFQILAKYDVLNTLPKSVLTVLSSSVTKHSTQQDYSHVYNVVIGSNRLALEGAKYQAEQLGYLTILLSDAVCGEVSTVARFYSLLIQFVCLSIIKDAGSRPLRDSVKEMLTTIAGQLEIPVLSLIDPLTTMKEPHVENPICLLAGGETTVQVQGSGKGGRNQELALRVALELHRAKSTMEGSCLNKYEVMFLSGGTDGQDGPTEAAGAFCSQDLVEEAEQAGFDVESTLSNNDSYTFFTKFQNGHRLLVTGLTGTNVMDIHAVLIRTRRT
ncbi:glycerate kinase isoform X1 [Crotalus tigris]|uniref:glycerate kinase isoform X1 n=2 Tax=Crotalus tigris TaxID=88082 RepID=UPI00192F4D48|nr:glycerate kinase isoform X1 [Crotalus tigris]